MVAAEHARRALPEHIKKTRHWAGLWKFWERMPERPALFAFSGDSSQMRKHQCQLRNLHHDSAINAKALFLLQIVKFAFRQDTYA
jgi:hypothetical protein